jgi:hypothetical protein
MAVGLGIARLDDFVDIDAIRRREQRKLVSQADVDVSIGGLRELRHLCSLGRSEIPNAVRSDEVGSLVEVENRLVEVSRRGSPSLGQPPDQLRVLTQIGENASRKDSLR